MYFKFFQPYLNPFILDNGYPYRVQPPMPPGATMIPPYNHHSFPPPPGYPSMGLPVNSAIPGTSTYIDLRTRSINKAREDEENRLKRQRKHNKDIESVELTQEGMLLVNHGKPDEDPNVYVAQHLTHVLKPHQLGGIRFMYVYFLLATTLL